MNKHGYIGIRKRTDYPWRRKPWYARLALGCDQFIYSRNFATAAEAAAEYQRMRQEIARAALDKDTGK